MKSRASNGSRLLSKPKTYEPAKKIFLHRNLSRPALFKGETMEGSQWDSTFEKGFSPLF